MEQPPATCSSSELSTGIGLKDQAERVSLGTTVNFLTGAESFDGGGALILKQPGREGE